MAGNIPGTGRVGKGKMGKRLDGGAATAILRDCSTRILKGEEAATARRGNIHADVFGVNDSGISRETASFHVKK